MKKDIPKEIKERLKLYIKIKNCRYEDIRKSFTQHEFDLLSTDNYIPFDVYLKVCPYTENKRMIKYMPMCIINKPFSGVIDDWNNYWKIHIKYKDISDIYKFIDTPEKKIEFFKNKLDWDWNWDIINSLLNSTSN